MNHHHHLLFECREYFGFELPSEAVSEVFDEIIHASVVTIDTPNIHRLPQKVHLKR